MKGPRPFFGTTFLTKGPRPFVRNTTTQGAPPLVVLGWPQRERPPGLDHRANLFDKVMNHNIKCDIASVIPTLRLTKATAITQGAEVIDINTG